MSCGSDCQKTQLLLDTGMDTCKQLRVLAVDLGSAMQSLYLSRSLCVWQGFRSPEEVQRFSDMMEEMCYIVATKHSGSLKASSSQFC